MSEHLDRCAICGGTREEHNNGTRHMFTLNAGELRLPPRVENTSRKQGPDYTLGIVSRLIETLVDNDTLTKDEALAIFGVGHTRPVPSERVDINEN